MNFEDKYNSEKEEADKPEPDKTTLSNEAYAIAELLNDIKHKLQNLI